MSNQKEPSNTCRICGNTQNNTCYKAREMMFGLRHEFDYHQCSVCNCLQIATVPEDMSPYYPEQYYSFGSHNDNKFKGFKGLLRRWKYAALIDHGSVFHRFVRGVTGRKDYDLFKGLQVEKSTRILDVGCGSGQNFLYPLAEVGFGNLLGCDPYLEQPIKYDNGLCIEKYSIHDIKGQWDIITLHHAFEHISDPRETLSSAYGLLAPKGTVVIRIPTVSSYAWEHYRTNWVQLDAPRHFFIHSMKSMQLLAEKTDFELYKVEYDSSEFQFLGSEKYVEDISLFEKKEMGFSEKFQNKIQKRKFKKRAEELNATDNGDQAAFFFRKKAGS